MTTSQAIIDLSAIPVPDAVEVPDTAVLVTQIVAKYQELDTLFSALVESDPAYKWAEALAFRVALMRQQVNDESGLYCLPVPAGTIWIRLVRIFRCNVW